MKNNIKKAPVKFRKDLLYFQHFMLIFVFPQISDYHHLNDIKINHGSLQSDWTSAQSAVRRTSECKYITALILALIEDFST